MQHSRLVLGDRDLASFAELVGGTPFYLSSTSQLLGHMSEASRGEKDTAGTVVRVAYSVKSNYLAHFVMGAYEAGHLIEVVSPNEYDYVRGLGVEPNCIVVNGPGKRAEFVAAAADAGATVNFDSMEEVRALHQWASERGGVLEIGVRVAATLSSGHISRFGIHVEDGPTAAELRTLLDGSVMRCTSLHVHHSSRRDAESFAERVRVLSNAIKILALPNVKTLDIGGGFASDPPEEVRARLSYPIDPIPQCVDAAVEELNAAFPDPGSRPDLLIEPGLGVLADTMEYFCRVVAIKPLDDRWAIITDGSMFEIDPFRGAIGPPTAPISSESTGVHTGRGTLYGSTCMEIDQLGDVADVSGIQVGDYVRTANVGAYAVSLAPEFIFRRAPVICVDTGRVVRERQESGHFTGSGA